MADLPIPDVYQAKIQRYNTLQQQYLLLVSQAGPDVSDQGRSINWTSRLNQMAEELSKLETELRQGQSVEVVTSMLGL